MASTPESSTIVVHIQPRASRTEVVGWHGDAIKIRIKAPPVEGAANRELLRFLAQRLHVSPSAVQLLSGAGGRRKRVCVAGLTSDQIERQLVGPTE